MSFLFWILLGFGIGCRFATVASFDRTAFGRLLEGLFISAEKKALRKKELSAANPWKAKWPFSLMKKETKETKEKNEKTV